MPSEDNALLCLKDLSSHITNGLTSEVWRCDTDTRPTGLADPESVSVAPGMGMNGHWQQWS